MVHPRLRALPSACAFECAHPLLLSDCVARPMVRGFHNRSSYTPVKILAKATCHCLAAGWLTKDVTASQIKMGTRIERCFASDLALHATVMAPFAHDTIHAIYVCGLSTITSNSSIIHLPPRMLLLKVPWDNGAKLPWTAHTEAQKECPFAWCQCGKLVGGVGERVLRALNHRMTKGYVDDDQTDVENILPLIDITLLYLYPPTQYVDDFVEDPYTRLLDDDEPGPYSVPDPAQTANPQSGHPCTFPYQHLACHCEPTSPGASQIIDEEFVERVLNSGGEQDEGKKT